MGIAPPLRRALVEQARAGCGLGLPFSAPATNDTASRKRYGRSTTKVWANEGASELSRSIPSSDVASLANPSRYDIAFYASIASTSKRAATVVLPPVLILLDRCGYPVRSAVDVGAGLGSWLAVACEHGVSDILALEGAWVRDVTTAVPADAYSYVDVGEPLVVARRFDLAVCVEVAEHLPATRAEQLVENLVGLSDVVLFSAAIPHQGGTHHVNEQWPCYWADLFRTRNYLAWDGLRWSLWRDSRVPFWYRQNMLIFVSTKRQELCRALLELPYADFMPDSPCACVHPAKYEAMIEFSRCPPVRLLLPALPKALYRAFDWRLRRFFGWVARQRAS
jgi:hypothetical protein